MRANNIVAEIGWYIHEKYPHLVSSRASIVYDVRKGETVSKIIASSGNIIDQIAPDFVADEDSAHYPFKVRCAVIRAHPPRAKKFTHWLNIGYSDIDRVLYQTGGELSGDLVFFMPERHMCVAEQNRFMYELVKHPDVDKITSVDLITSNPMLVSNFRKESVRVITYDGDWLFEGRSAP